LKPEDLGRLFASFQRSAFRLETLPAYSIDSEAESFRLWREGGPEPVWREERPWLTTIRAAVARGATMERVRVVRRPLSDYIRFELDWGYPANVEAGEDIRILELAPADALPWIPDPALGYDFWVFDAVTVVRMEYDGAGRFIGPVDASANEVPFIDVRDWAMHRAEPFSSYRHRAITLPAQLRPALDDPAVQAEVIAHFRRDRRTF
jgi:hypothetical protein